MKSQIANRKSQMGRLLCLKLMGLMASLWVMGDVILAPVQGDAEAVRFHLWASQGTNEFSELAVIGTNSFFQITNRLAGRWRFYVVSEDEEGNLSERSSYVVVKPRLKKPVLVLHLNGTEGTDGGEVKRTEARAPTNLGGATREELQVLSGPNYRPLERKIVELPTPPLP